MSLGSDKGGSGSGGPGSSKSTLVRGVTKKVFRTRELVLQNLGKVDKTQDELFDEFLSNFAKQQVTAAKLQKYLHGYIQSERAAVFAANALQDVMKEVYEDSWPGSSEFAKHMDEIRLTSSEYLRELDRSASGLLAHQAQFHDVKSKIEKRKRKLVDYDSSRHAIEQLRQAKKKDDPKLMKAEEKTSDARRMYESLNQELLDLLPALWDSRVVTYGSTFQSLFSAEANFHAEVQRLNAALSEVIDTLFAERGNEASARLPPPVYAVISRTGSVSSPREGKHGGSSRGSTTSYSSTRVKAGGGISSDSALQSGSRSNSLTSADHHHHQALQQHQLHHHWRPPSISTSQAGTSQLSASQPALSGSHDSLALSATSAGSSVGAGEYAELHTLQQNGAVRNGAAQRMAQSDVALEMHKDDDGFESEDLADSPSKFSDASRSNAARSSAAHASASGGIGEAGAASDYSTPVLYQVVATHPYVREDDDELTFNAADIINVLPHEDEDPDEGWLFGCLADDPEVRGVFPANFTRKYPET